MIISICLDLGWQPLNRRVPFYKEIDSDLLQSLSILGTNSEAHGIEDALHHCVWHKYSCDVPNKLIQWQL